MIKIALITIVISMKQDAEGWLVDTKDGAFHLQHSLRAYTVFYQTLKSSMDTKTAIALVHHEKSNQLEMVYDTTQDWVGNVEEDPKQADRCIITLRMRPSPAYLDKKGPQHSHILGLLKKAKEDNTQLTIAINPATGFIEAAKKEAPADKTAQ